VVKQKNRRFGENVYRLSNTNVLWEPDFIASYCRAGVPLAMERFTLAGETPALHS
jgi:hypothetical protein